MFIPANIIKKYITSKKMATKTLEITLKRPVFLVPGDTIVLNPNKKDLIQIVKKEIFAVPLPYNDN